MGPTVITPSIPLSPASGSAGDVRPEEKAENRIKSGKVSARSRTFILTRFDALTIQPLQHFNGPQCLSITSKFLRKPEAAAAVASVFGGRNLFQKADRTVETAAAAAT